MPTPVIHYRMRSILGILLHAGRPLTVQEIGAWAGKQPIESEPYARGSLRRLMAGGRVVKIRDGAAGRDGVVRVRYVVAPGVGHGEIRKRDGRDDGGGTRRDKEPRSGAT
jgi:hypothetical protein